MATASAHRDERLIMSTPAVERALAKAAERAHKIAVALGGIKPKHRTRRKAATR